MIDLSYTNKDGLNPAEGFENIFNYHKDAASSGQGYANGGYPEITGETSDLYGLNYKTGDILDHWGNGNTFDIITADGEAENEVVSFTVDSVYYLGDDGYVANIIVTYANGDKEILCSGSIEDDYVADYEHMVSENGAIGYRDNVAGIDVTSNSETAGYTVVYKGISVEWSKNSGDDGR